MTRRRSRAWIGVVGALIAAWWVLAPLAGAQPRMPLDAPLPSLTDGAWFGDAEDDPVLVNASIGFGRSVLIDRWTPMRLTIASTSLEGYEGLVRVRVSIDGELRVHEVPFALSPGVAGEGARETTTVFVGFISAGLNPNAYSIGFEVIGRPLGTRGRMGVLQRGVFEPGLGSRAVAMPPSLDRGDPVVLSVGQSSVRSSVISTIGVGGLDSGGFRGMFSAQQVRVIQSEVAQLPFPASRWMLFDGFDAVVLSRDSLTGLGASQKEALRGWVDFGGHLVIVSDLLGVDAGGLLPGGAVSATIVDAGGDREGTGRVSLALTQAGEVSGWMVLPLPGVPEGSAVSGPVGLGWVTVLSRDVAFGLEPDEVSAIWRTVLRIDVLMRLRESVGGGGHSMYRSGMSPDMGAVRQTLDHAASVLGVEPIPGWLIGLVVLGLGLLIAVGTTFGDWFLLGSPRRRRLSFLTALGWLVAGSAVALVVPMLMRAGETRAVRIQVIDINAATGGVACGEVFALSVGRRQRFTPPGQGAGVWTRPVSALASGGLGDTAVSEQFAGNMVGSSSAPLWTFHAAIGEAVGSVPGLSSAMPDIGARIEFDAATDEPVLTIRIGLGRIAGERVHVAFMGAAESDDAAGSGALVSVYMVVPEGDAALSRHRISLRSALRSGDRRDGFWPRGRGESPSGWAPWNAGVDPLLLSGIPGVALRNASVHAALGTGRYAAVTMRINLVSDEVAAMDAAAFDAVTEPEGLIDRGIVQRWVRVLVPIDERMRAVLVDVYDTGTAGTPVEGAEQ